MRGSTSVFEREENLHNEDKELKEICKHNNTLLSKGGLAIFPGFNVVVPFIPDMPPVAKRWLSKSRLRKNQRISNNLLLRT